MATSIEQILGKDINSLKELREEIKRLQDSIVNASEGTDEWEAASVKLNAAQNQLAAVTNAGKKSVDAAKDSIVGMEREYKNLYNTYKTLSEEQRNSDFGKEMANSLSELGEKLNSTKKEVGNFKDNIGHYSNDIMGAFSQMGISLGNFEKPFQALVGVVQNGSKNIEGSMGAAGSSAAGLGQAMAALKNPAGLATKAVGMLNAALTTLAANPVALAILAIVVAVKKMKEAMDKAQESVKEAIHNNEELEMSLNESQAYMQAFSDFAANVWDKIAGFVVKVKEFFNGIGEGLATLGAKFLDWTGITNGAEKTLKSYKELAKAQNQLTKAKREYQVLNAKDKAEVERLREAASETEDLDEKVRLLNEAKEKQAEIDQRNLEIAQEELRILEEQAKRTKNGAEMNDKLAAAQAKVYETSATASANERQFNKQINAVSKTIKSDAAAAMKELAAEQQKVADSAKDLYDELVEDSKDELTKLEEKYRKEKQLLEKYGYDTTLLTKRYQAQRTEIIVRTEKAESDAMKNNLSERRTYNDWLESLEKDEEKRERMHLETLQKTYKKASEKQNEFYKTMGDKWKSGRDESLLPGMEDWIKDFVDKFNAEFGTELKFPPTSDEEPWATRYKNFKTLFNKIVKEMGAAVGDYKRTIASNNLSAEWGLITDDVDVYVQKTLKQNVRTSELLKKSIKNFQDSVKGGNKEVAATYKQELVNLAKDMDEYPYERAADGTKKYKEMSEREFERWVKQLKKKVETYNFELNKISEANYRALNSEYSYRQLTAEKELLQDSLKNWKGTAEQKAAVQQRLFEIEMDLMDRRWAAEELDYERRTQLQYDWLETVQNVGDATNSMISSAISLRESEIDLLVKQGKISEEEAKAERKRLEKYQWVMMGVEMATIAANTAAGIMGIWKAYALEKAANAETALATGPTAAGTLAALNAKSLTSAILQTVGLATTGLAQMAAAAHGTISTVNGIKGDTLPDNSAAASATASPTEIDSTPYSYTRTVQTADEMEALNRPIYVTVTDINEAQRRVQVRDQEASF